MTGYRIKNSHHFYQKMYRASLKAREGVAFAFCGLDYEVMKGTKHETVTNFWTYVRCEVTKCHWLCEESGVRWTAASIRKLYRDGAKCRVFVVPIDNENEDIDDE